MKEISHGRAMAMFDRLVEDFAMMGLELQRGLPNHDKHYYGPAAKRDVETLFLTLGGKVMHHCDDVAEMQAIWDFFHVLSMEDVKIERMREPDRLLNRFKLWLPGGER